MSIDILSRHSPNVMNPSTLEALFVQRDELANQIVELMRESIGGRSKHYVLLVGPRGIGKTHLISIVHHRLTSSLGDMDGRALVAWLREEEYGIESFLDLIVRILRSLATCTDYSARRVDALYKMPPADAEDAAAALLKDYAGTRTLVVLAENLDGIFRGLGDKGQRQLRSYIQENPFWAIVATTPSLFTAVSKRTSPFYGFFQIDILHEFSTDEFVELLTKIASQHNDSDLVEFLKTPSGRARVRAVRHLASGNPRICVVFSSLLTREKLDEMVPTFMEMLDELTPYYNHKIQCLSIQQRKIVEVLCDYGGAASVKLIAERCFISSQTASSQLASLRRDAYVHTVTYGGKGRESYYELHEPLMRLCTEMKKNRGEPIPLLADFMRVWYSQKELADMRDALGQGSDAGYPALALSRNEPGRDLRIDVGLAELKKTMATGDFPGTLSILEEVAALRRELGDDVCLSDISDELPLLLNAVEERISGSDYTGALDALDKIRQLVRSNAQLDLLYGIVLLRLFRHPQALEAFDSALTIDSRSAAAHYQRALRQDYVCVLCALNRWDAAFVQMERLLDNDDDSVGLWWFLDDTSVAVLRFFLDSIHLAGTRQRLQRLADIYCRHAKLSNLGEALVRSTAALDRPSVSAEARTNWAAWWKEIGGEHTELLMAVKLLDMAVRYLDPANDRDPRVLLALPAEERKILEEALGIESAVVED